MARRVLHWRMAGLAVLLGAGMERPAALGDVFTYQGELRFQEQVVSNACDFRFRLYDAATGGTLVGTAVDLSNVSVREGRFTVELDFGAGVFDGSGRWIEIDVRCPAGSGSYVTLSPRQPVQPAPMAYFALSGNAGPPGSDALWEVDGTVMYYTGGNVGIGTTQPAYPLEVKAATLRAVSGETSSPGGLGVVGKTTAASSTTAGVWGQSESSDGRGVVGFVSSSTGVNTGVWGQSASSGGRGVFGWATAGTGANYGGYFRSDSISGTGVHGEASSTIGVTTGIYGKSISSEGRGVVGHAWASAGVTYGVYGRSDSPNGFDFFAAGPGTDYGTASSRRWKKDIRNIDDPLGKISRLRGVYFTWDKEHGGKHDVGMIAEEVGQVLPEIVQYEENGVDAIGLDYAKLTPLLVEAVNALRTENAKLRDRLASRDRETDALRNRLAELEARVAGLASR